MAQITIDVRPGQNGPVYVITAPAGNTVTVNDYMHPDASVAGTGATTPIQDALGRKGKQHSQTF